MIPVNNTYVTNENEKIKDIMDRLNISVNQIADLYLAPDQIIRY